LKNDGAFQKTKPPDFNKIKDESLKGEKNSNIQGIAL